MNVLRPTTLKEHKKAERTIRNLCALIGEEIYKAAMNAHTDPGVLLKNKKNYIKGKVVEHVGNSSITEILADFIVHTYFDTTELDKQEEN